MTNFALPIEWLPAAPPEQLVVLLHGGSASGAAMAPLAQALRAEFPRAALLAPDAPLPAERGAHDDAPGRPCRQWFDPVDLQDPARAPRIVAAVLPPLWGWLRATQQRLGVAAPATAIAGFAQGAVLALETAVAQDGIAGRVLAFSGRFAATPARAPQLTTVHLLHGGDDAVIPPRWARHALRTLGSLGGDATLDIADGVQHELHPVLIGRALFQLRNHIPARTWAEALGAAPARR